MNSLRSKFSDFLMRPVDASTLGFFRICWGVMMCLEANWLHNQMQDRHHPDVFHFYYPGFSWIRHFPEAWMMELEMIVMLIAALLMSFGILFRISVTLFTLTYTHFFFSEALTYNNHFYLIILINFLLILTNADEAYSFKQRAHPEKRKFGPLQIPAWNYVIVQWQVVIVYFYGAVAKINQDWLIEMEPVRFWLNHSPHVSNFVTNLVRQELFIPVMAWGGLAIDLFCPLMLLIKRSRAVAIIALVSFHALNSQIFSIGYFPLIGIILLIPFLPPDVLLRRRKSDEPIIEFKPPTLIPLNSFPILQHILLVHFLFQLAFPLRWHLWRPANPAWTLVGHEFSWRMMLIERIGTLEIRFPDPRVREWIAQRPAFLPLLAPSAQLSMEQNPHYIWQYVQEIKKTLAQYGKGDTPIHVFATCSLNGRPYYPIINPHVDLAKADFPLGGVPDWILPLPDLKVDFDQIFPLEESRRFGKEALEKWIAENPGPASSIPPTIFPSGPLR